MVSLNKGLQKCECKINAIRKDLGTFKHNQVYPGIIQAYSGIFKTLFNPGIFRIMVYPEPWHSEPKAYSETWHIHNFDIFRTRAYFECWHIQNPKHMQNIVKHLR